MGSVTEDRIVGTGVRALRGNSDAVLEDRVTRPRVAEAKKLDTEKRLALCGKAGALDAIDFVPNVYS